MRADRRSGRQKFFHDDVAIEGAALVAAIALGPGHPDPPPGTELATELGIAAVPGLRPLTRQAVGDLLRQKVAHFQSEVLRVEARRRREIENIKHRPPPS